MTAGLFLTYNRIAFTEQTLPAFVASDIDLLYVIDNGSSDGTHEWIMSQDFKRPIRYYANDKNLGIAGAVNQFLNLLPFVDYCVKCDNDTVLPKDFCAKMIPHMKHADVVQAKHCLLKETHPKGFDDWVSRMPRKGALRFNHFVGGTGIMFKRDVVDEIPDVEWMLGGWRQWQRENPHLRKAFATDVEIKLLDTDENGSKYPDEYIEYYKETKRC